MPNLEITPPTASQVMEWQTVHWHLEVGDQVQPVPVEFIANSTKPDVIVLPGLKEDAFLEPAIRHLADLNIRAVGVKLIFPGTSDADIDPGRMSIDEIVTLTLTNAVPLVADQFNETVNGRPGKRLHIIGNSGGAGAAIIEAARDAAAGTNRYAAVGMLNPPGFTREFVELEAKTPAKTDKLRLKEFLDRMTLNGFSPDAKPEITVSDMRRLNYTLRQTIGRQLLVSLIEADYPVRIFSGAEDPVFPTHKILETLGADMERYLQVLPISRHALLATEKGREDLAVVAAWAMKQDRSQPQSAAVPTESMAA